MTEKYEIISANQGIFQYFILFKHPKIQKQQTISKLKQWKNRTDSIKYRNEQKNESTSKIERKVRFDDKDNIKIIYVWPFAHRQARTDIWQQIARDNSRFAKTITDFDKLIGPILRKKQITSIQI